MIEIVFGWMLRLYEALGSATQLSPWVYLLVMLGGGASGISPCFVPVLAMPIFRWVRKPSSIWGSFALGLPFGLVVTPCTIPIFIAIVTFVALQASVFHGALLMVAYALGRGTILLAVAVSAGLLKSLNVGRTSWYIERVSGTAILVASLGVLLFYRDFVQWTMQWMLMGLMR